MPKMNEIVGIAVALLVTALVLPIGIDALATTQGWAPENTATIEGEVLATGDGSTENFSGSFNNGYIIEDETRVFGDVDNDGATENFYEDGDVVEITDYKDGTYELTFDNTVVDGQDISADYEYATEYSEWNSAVLTILKVLLPILATLGIVVLIYKRAV